MTTAAATETRKFETKSCGRCGGCGRYSYNQIDGDRCFGCLGSGKVYTKRGKAAVEFLKASRTIKAGDVKVGMRINVRGVGKFTVRVAELTDQVCRSTTDGVTTEYRHLHLKGETLGIYTFATSDVELILPTAEFNAQIIAALDYQDTLTEAGKPRKR